MNRAALPIALLILPLMYFASYVWLREDQTYAVYARDASGKLICHSATEVGFKHGGRLAEILFVPTLYLDEMVRDYLELQ